MAVIIVADAVQAVLVVTFHATVVVAAVKVIFVVAFDNIVIHEANTDATVTVVATAMACALLNPNNTAATYRMSSATKSGTN